MHPPAPHKQFLISPPASPPIGWEPREEGEPLVNHDLLAAIANLTPGTCSHHVISNSLSISKLWKKMLSFIAGESHELHPGGSNQPGIVVHICENAANAVKSAGRIPHTRCPDE